MTTALHELISFFKYQNKLKTVFRSNAAPNMRQESSAEHSWSVAMMVWMLAESVGQEFNQPLDQLKAVKMALLHDIVEIDAGDVAAWDSEGRAAVTAAEHAAIDRIQTFFTSNLGDDIHALWTEHDQLQTLESKLVKACDQLCPLIYRLVFKAGYAGTGVNRAKLDSIFIPVTQFSTTLTELYQLLASELESAGLLDGNTIKAIQQ